MEAAGARAPVLFAAGGKGYSTGRREFAADSLQVQLCVFDAKTISWVSEDKNQAVRLRKSRQP